MVAIEPIDWIVIFSYSVVCITFLIVGIIFLLKARDKPEIVRKYLLGIGLFFLLYGIGRIGMFTFEWSFPMVVKSMTGGFEPQFVWRLSSDDTSNIFLTYQTVNVYHDIVWRITTGIGSFGLVLLMYQLEIHILERKTKFLFTIIQIVTTLPAMIFGVAQGAKDEISPIRIVLYVGNALMAVIPLTYLYLAYKTSGDTRKRAIGATIGMLIMFLGVVFNSSIGKTLFANLIMVQYLMFGIFVVIGSVIYLKSIQY